MDFKVEYILTAVVGLFSIACLKILLSFFRKVENPCDDVISRDQTTGDDVITEDKNASSRRRKGGVSQRKMGGGSGGDKGRRFSHDWLVCSLKGHSGTVLDAQFSADAKYLASCADDNTVIIWSTRHLTSSSTSADSSGDGGLSSTAPPRSCRINIELDLAQRVAWSPDGRALVLARHGDQRLQVMKLARRSDGLLGSAGTALDFRCENGDIIGAAIASNGKFIMSCTASGQLTLYDIKANVLTSIDTHQGGVYCARISPCAKFVLTAGFTPEVMVWCVEFSKDGSSFQRLQQAFSLTGHRTGVLDVDVSPDSRRMLTTSKDGTWRLHNTDVEYLLGQSPSTLCSADFTDVISQTAKNTGSLSVCGALSPDGTTIVIGCDTSVLFYSALDASQLAIIEHAHSGGIKRVLFDPSSLLVLTAGDRQMHVLHNVPGRQVTCQDLKQKLAQCKNASMKERLSSQLAEIKNFIAKFDK